MDQRRVEQVRNETRLEEVNKGEAVCVDSSSIRELDG
jgi:hypothetical protein